MNEKRRLSDKVADDILTMITIEQRFLPGEQLPNENELAQLLQVSRTTLREAIRILVAHGVIESIRGKGTFVKQDFNPNKSETLAALANAKMNIKDLYEIRLIFEPEAAYYATLRATDKELARILTYGKEIEAKIKQRENRTEEERQFHRAIANATHNAFIDKLMPIIFQAIDQGVLLSETNESVITDTLRDHQLIMEFMETRNPDGAKSAMKIHILHAMQRLGISF